MIKIKTILKLCLLTPFISSCAQNSNWLSFNEGTEQTRKAEAYVSNSLHWHVEKLTRQLLSTAQSVDTTNTVAVGTILPAVNSSGEALPHDMAMGLQIQESLMTFATQAGLKVIEYKTMPSIKIGEQSDTMLSRNINQLKTDISAGYFLTGTYTLQETSTMVNIRLIQVPENLVLAAATDYVPNDVMWSKSKVTVKNNHIYRSAY